MKLFLILSQLKLKWTTAAAVPPPAAGDDIFDAGPGSTIHMYGGNERAAHPTNKDEEKRR